MAAGMGSRYGGLKQIDPMGPNGETLIEYSVFDAIRAGFGKVVFIIRTDFAEAFKEQLGSKFEGQIEVAYAYQELGDLPEVRGDASLTVHDPIHVDLDGVVGPLVDYSPEDHRVHLHELLLSEAVDLHWLAQNIHR